MGKRWAILPTGLWSDDKGLSLDNGLEKLSRLRVTCITSINITEVFEIVISDDVFFVFVEEFACFLVRVN